MTYSIEDLLVGKRYVSSTRRFDGEIISAEKREDMYADNAYLVYVREYDYPSYHYATVLVDVS